MTDNLNSLQQPELSEQDAELLSAYIDNMLAEDDRRLLEQRLQTEPQLARELGALRQTVNWINELPIYKAPRDFTITPADVRPLETPDSTPKNIISLGNRNGWLVSAAAVIFVLIGVIIVLPQLTNSPSMNETTGDIAQSAQEIASVPSPTALELTSPADAVARGSEPPTSPEVMSVPQNTGAGASAEAESDSDQAFSSAMASDEESSADDAVGSTVMTTADEAESADDSVNSAMADTDVSPEVAEVETVEEEADVEANTEQIESADLADLETVETDMNAESADMTDDFDTAEDDTSADGVVPETRLIEPQQQSQLSNVLSFVQEVLELFQAIQRAIQP